MESNSVCNHTNHYAIGGRRVHRTIRFEEIVIPMIIYVIIGLIREEKQLKRKTGSPLTLLCTFLTGDHDMRPSLHSPRAHIAQSVHNMFSSFLFFEPIFFLVVSSGFNEMPP